MRFLKITNDTTSLNISSVVSSVYTPTIPHLNTYAASIQRGIPIHHVPIMSIIIIIFVTTTYIYFEKVRKDEREMKDYLELAEKLRKQSKGEYIREIRGKN